MLRGLTRFGTLYDAAVLRIGGRARPGTARDALWLTVVGREEVADGVVSLRLGGPALPAWQPGCHVDLHLPSGLRRQYSLCGDPEDDTYRIAVRAVGAGSREVQALGVGDRIQVRGPRNAFPFAGIGPVVFVAGGIGITPILPMVHAAARAGLDWRLVYCGRSTTAMPFLDELPIGRVDIRIGRGGPLLTDADPNGAVYCCGPASMLAQVREEFSSRWLHFERFSPPPIVGGRPFTVELRRSGVSLHVPADRSALDVIRDFRPSVAYSCRQGFCGTCDVGGVRICVDRPTGDRLVVEEL
ncbi:PDR/VanB family oxidoreductase [Lentzea flava]|uniref:Oxidoreductase n=1 Tax=Lentzea flava TaxID=103732 RepID=A0ABQ2UDL7_9PSEU|nr:2Fe-2S iron-sulfur cluster-binding protein [Lentzea flava]MCP2198029.1 Ferredoxin-NADP reductase [Lentzea flava]GGU24161.1 oxidoreductase [Lentzea flava]